MALRDFNENPSAKPIFGHDSAPFRQIWTKLAMNHSGHSDLCEQLGPLNKHPKTVPKSEILVKKTTFSNESGR